MLLLAAIALIIILLLVVRRRGAAKESGSSSRRSRGAGSERLPDGPRPAKKKYKDKGIGHQRKVKHKKIRTGTRDEAIVMLLEALEALVVATATQVEGSPQVRTQWEAARRGAERVRLATDEGPPRDDADAKELLALLLAGLADAQDVRREVLGLAADHRAPLLDGFCLIDPAHGLATVRVTAADRPQGVDVCGQCHATLREGGAPADRRFGGEPVWNAAVPLNELLGSPTGTLLILGT